MATEFIEPKIIVKQSGSIPPFIMDGDWKLTTPNLGDQNPQLDKQIQNGTLLRYALAPGQMTETYTDITPYRKIQVTAFAPEDTKEIIILVIEEGFEDTPFLLHRCIFTTSHKPTHPTEVVTQQIGPRILAISLNAADQSNRSIVIPPTRPVMDESDYRNLMALIIASIDQTQ